MRSFEATAENSGFQQSEGLMSYYASAAISWAGENVPAVARMYRYAGEFLTEPGETLTAHLITPHQTVSAEHTASSHDHDKESSQRAGMFLAWLKLLTAKNPDAVSTETWTPFGDIVRAMAAGARARLLDRPKPRARRLTHGDGD